MSRCRLCRRACPALTGRIRQGVWISRAHCRQGAHCLVELREARIAVHIDPHACRAEQLRIDEHVRDAGCVSHAEGARPAGEARVERGEVGGEVLTHEGGEPRIHAIFLARLSKAGPHRGTHRAGQHEGLDEAANALGDRQRLGPVKRVFGKKRGLAGLAQGFRQLHDGH